MATAVSDCKAADVTKRLGGWREYDFNGTLRPGESSLGLEVDYARSGSKRPNAFRVASVYGHEGQQVLAPGDIIIAINGMEPETITDFFKVLRGGEGSTVTLTVLTEKNRAMHQHEAKLVRRTRVDLTLAAAESGDAAAQLCVGIYYMRPQEPAERDAVARAKHWLEKAYAQHNMVAAAWLGSIYASGEEEGKGGQPNWDKAVTYYNAAAVAGEEFAQYELGNCYLYGRGVPKNPEEAGHWYLKSAEKGYEDAMEKVASGYAKGDLFPKDDEKAWYWDTRQTYSGQEAYRIAMDLLEPGVGGKSKSNSEFDSEPDEPAFKYDTPLTPAQRFSEGMHWLKVSCDLMYPDGIKRYMAMQLKLGHTGEAAQLWLRWLKSDPDMNDMQRGAAAQAFIVAEGPLPLALWVVIVPSLVAFTGFSAAAWLSCRPLRLLPADAHWSQRAAAAWAPRSSSLMYFALCTFLPGLALIQADAVVMPYPKAAVVTFAVLATATGSFYALARMQSAIFQRRRTVPGILCDILVLITFFSASTLLPPLVMYLFSPTLSHGWGLLAAVLGCIAFGAAHFYTAGLPLLKLLGLARPAPARIVALVEEAARRAGTTPRPVYAIRWGMANAIAFPGNNTLGITERACDILSDEQIVAVMAHELAHLNEGPEALRQRLMLCIVPGCFLMVLVACFVQNSPTALFMMVGATVVVYLLTLNQASFARKMEEKADEAGRAVESNAGHYAAALEQIYRANLVPAVLSPTPRHTHPELYDRMISSGLTPDFPRPAPPKRWSLPALLALIILMCTFIFLFHLFPAWIVTELATLLSIPLPY